MIFEYRSYWWRSSHPNVRLSANIGTEETWLISIRVDEEMRGKGLGAQAVEAVIAQRPSNTIFVYALPDHPTEMKKLLKFYYKFGFRLFGFQDIGSESKLLRRIPCR